MLCYAMQSALAKERRELREQQQRTLLEAIPKDLSRPWEDPLADAGERALAQELRGIGLGATEMPEWKQQASLIGGLFGSSIRGVCKMGARAGGDWAGCHRDAPVEAAGGFLGGFFE